MRVTISREDNIVIVNGTSLSVDCSDLAAYIRVIQWNGTTGWIEFVSTNGGFAPNIKIVDFGPYSYLVDRWRLALAERVAGEREDKARTIEEEIKRIETNKQQEEAMKLAADAVKNQLDQQRVEKQAIVDRLAALEAQRVDQETRTKELEKELERARAASAQEPVPVR